MLQSLSHRPDQAGLKQTQAIVFFYPASLSLLTTFPNSLKTFEQCVCGSQICTSCKVIGPYVFFQKYDSSSTSKWRSLSEHQGHRCVTDLRVSTVAAVTESGAFQSSPYLLQCCISDSTIHARLQLGQSGLCRLSSGTSQLSARAAASPPHRTVAASVKAGQRSWVVKAEAAY